MAITTSLVADVEQALLTALRARDDLDSDIVKMGPTGTLEAGDYIITGVSIGDDSLSVVQEYAASGNLRKREQGTVFGMISVHRSSSGEAVTTAASARAWELLAEIEEEVRTAMQPGSNHGLRLGGKAHRFELTTAGERRGMDSQSRWSEIPWELTYEGDLPFS